MVSPHEQHGNNNNNNNFNLLTFQLWLFKVNYKFKVYLQIKILVKDGKSYFKNSLSSLLKRPISIYSRS